MLFNTIQTLENKIRQTKFSLLLFLVNSKSYIFEVKSSVSSCTTTVLQKISIFNNIKFDLKVPNWRVK